MTSRRAFLGLAAGLAAATLARPAAAVPSSVLGQQMSVPIGSLPRVTYFQGAAWAKDPVTGREYLFQLQARPTGPGDIEDLSIHRYELVAGALRYLDTMVGKGWGHCQTLKVRITAASNPYVLLGWETYDAAGVQIGSVVYRVRYRKGTTQTRAYADAQRLYVPGSVVIPVDCPDWTIAVRRAAGAYEVVEWYDEGELLAATAEAPATPKHSLTIPKAPDVIQGMCATGTWDRPQDVWRVNGPAGSPATLYRFAATGGPAQTLDVSDIVSGTAREEVEAVLRIGAELWVLKSCGEPSARTLVLRKVGTIG